MLPNFQKPTQEEISYEPISYIYDFFHFFLDTSYFLHGSVSEEANQSKSALTVRWVTPSGYTNTHLLVTV